MIDRNKISLKEASLILGGISTITVSRIAKNDTSFPKIEKIGRSIFIDRSALYVFISTKAGFPVPITDKAVTSKDLQLIFDKSHTWVWQNVKSGDLPKPFKINRSTFWMQSQIQALFQKKEA